MIFPVISLEGHMSRSIQGKTKLII